MSSLQTDESRAMNGTSAPLRAAMFATCLADSFYPDVGRSVGRVLRALHAEVTFPVGQTVTFSSYCGRGSVRHG